MEPSAAQETLKTAEVKSLTPLEFQISPVTYDETVLAANLANLTREKNQIPNPPEKREAKLVISSQIIYELAKDIPDDVVAKPEDPSQVTREFFKSLGQGSPEVAEAAFEGNPQIRQVILDAVLARLEQNAARQFDAKAQETIKTARELLRQPDFLSKFYIGSSSAILSGVEKAGGSLFSVSKLREKNIVRRTGEGMAYGASKDVIEQSGVAVTNSWEVANGYATLNSTAYYKTAEKAQAELAVIEGRIKEFEVLLAQPEKTTGDHAVIERGLANWAGRKIVTEEQLRGLLVERGPEESPFPIVFGFDELEITRPESHNTDSFRAGHEIDLKTKLARIYAPSDQTESVGQLLGRMDILQAKIYSIEALNSIRNVDPTWWKERENINAMVRDALNGLR